MMTVCPTIADRFQFKEDKDRLGQGNFGVVFRAFEKLTQRIVAIKLIERGKKFDKNCKDERAILEEINHPFIINLHSAYEEPSHHVLVMELAWGGALIDLLEEKARAIAARQERELTKPKIYPSVLELPKGMMLEIDYVGTLFAQLLTAVLYLHSMGLIHRDIKPHNIFFVDRERRFIKLGDFGTCCRKNNGKAKRTLTGTPAYMPPDGFRSAVTTLFDCWSMGVVLYEMLELHHPFRGIKSADYWRDDTAEIKYSHLRTDIPRDFVDLIGQLLCEKEKRISCEEMKFHNAIYKYYKKVHSLSI